MILLNGVAPIVGLGLAHVTVINIFAIVFEYTFIKKRHCIDNLALRAIVANLISLIAGLIVLLWIPNLIGGNIGRADGEMILIDKISLFSGLFGLFLANVVIEYPAYIIGLNARSRMTLGLFKTVLIANVFSNIPVFILYGLLAA